MTFFAAFTPERVALLAQGTLMTLGLAFVGVLIGMCLGTLFGVCSSRYFQGSLLARFIRVYVFVLQGTPLYVQILLVYFALPAIWGGGLSPITAVLFTLGVNSAAYVTTIVRAGVNAIHQGQWDAAYALGYSTAGTLRYIILPQAARNIFPALLNETISLVKETSIVGAIGVCDLTKVVRDLVNRTMDPFVWYLVAALMYLTLTSILGVIAKAVERKLDYDHRH